MKATSGGMLVQDGHSLMGAQVDALANLHTDLHPIRYLAPRRRLVMPELTARGWMQPASSQDTPSGMCGAMSAGRAENLATSQHHKALHPENGSD